MGDVWHFVCHVNDVPPEDVRRVEIRGFPPLAVFNIDGGFHVTDDRCTHSDASLAEGTIDGDVIECPFHGGRFHIPTSEVVCRPPKKQLAVYDSLIMDEQVMIR